MILQFTYDNYRQLCDTLAKKEVVFKGILRNHGYPPVWTRPLSYATLVHIILEQQVSLAAAKAAAKPRAKADTKKPAAKKAATSGKNDKK